MELIIWKVLTMVFMALGAAYAYRIATKPIDRTWLEVVIGVVMTSVLVVAGMALDIVYIDGDVTLLVVSLTLSLIFAFAVTGVPMILGQELKRELTEHHHQVTKGSLRDTRIDWESQSGDEEETMAKGKTTTEV